MPSQQLALKNIHRYNFVCIVFIVTMDAQEEYASK